MTREQMEELQPGDIIQNQLSGEGYVVLLSYGDGAVVATRTITATNPKEWQLIPKTTLEEVQAKVEEIHNKMIQDNDARISEILRCCTNVDKEYRIMRNRLKMCDTCKYYPEKGK